GGSDRQRARRRRDDDGRRRPPRRGATARQAEGAAEEVRTMIHLRRSAATVDRFHLRRCAATLGGPTSDIRYPLPDIRYPISATRYPISAYVQKHLALSDSSSRSDDSLKRYDVTAQFGFDSVVKRRSASAYVQRSSTYRKHQIVPPCVTTRTRRRAIVRASFCRNAYTRSQTSARLSPPGGRAKNGPNVVQ